MVRSRTAMIPTLKEFRRPVRIIFGDSACGSVNSGHARPGEHAGLMQVTKSATEPGVTMVRSGPSKVRRCHNLPSNLPQE
jgi:hypothetical protein